MNNNEKKQLKAQGKAPNMYMYVHHMLKYMYMYI